MRTRQRVLATFVLGTLLATTVMTADALAATPRAVHHTVTGTWAFQFIPTQGDPLPGTMVLVQTGTMVTGTLTYGSTAYTGLGKVKGNKIAMQFGDSRFGTGISGLIARNFNAMKGKAIYCMEKCIPGTFSATRK